MTRYAKISGRRPDAHKSSAEEKSLALTDTFSVNEGREENKEGHTVVQGGPSLANQTSKDAHREEDVRGDDVDGKRGVKQLLKSVKLLKLKAKKTSSTEKQKQILTRIHSLQQLVQEKNGQRGDEGKKAVLKKGGKAKEAIDAGNSAKAAGDLIRTQASEGITNPWKVMEAERRAKSNERSAHRREKRIEEREAAQRCYACRQLGHSAKFCDQFAANAPRESNQTDGGRSVVVHCYRCGSLEHSLAKCRKPTPRVGPELPFAHCFICQQRGHLASKCAENKGRGIYPHGGHCKLCKSVEHLARDCPLDEAQRTGGSTAASNASLGWMADVASLDARKRVRSGADEDDFHALSRQRHHLDRSEERKAKGDVGRGSDTSKRRKVVLF